MRLGLFFTVTELVTDTRNVTEDSRKASTTENPPRGEQLAVASFEDWPITAWQCCLILICDITWVNKEIHCLCCFETGINSRCLIVPHVQNGLTGSTNPRVFWYIINFSKEWCQIKFCIGPHPPKKVACQKPQTYSQIIEVLFLPKMLSPNYSVVSEVFI